MKRSWSCVAAKVGVLVSELLDMRKKDPTGKAAVFR